MLMLISIDHASLHGVIKTIGVEKRVLFLHVLTGRYIIIFLNINLLLVAATIQTMLLMLLLQIICDAYFYGVVKAVVGVKQGVFMAFLLFLHMLTSGHMDIIFTHLNIIFKFNLFFRRNLSFKGYVATFRLA